MSSKIRCSTAPVCWRRRRRFQELEQSVFLEEERPPHAALRYVRGCGIPRDCIRSSTLEWAWLLGCPWVCSVGWLGVLSKVFREVLVMASVLVSRWVCLTMT